MDNHFPSPDLQSDPTGQKINCRCTVRPDSRRVPGDFRSNTLQLKYGDVKIRTSGDKTAVFWKDERDVHMRMNIHDQLAEGNFRDKGGTALKPAVVDYN
jgi:uncharacterized protein with gpF-like domain